MWVNYFGKPYLLDKDFRLPDDNVTVGHGVRVQLTETPEDERLADLAFINQKIDLFNPDWFRRLVKIKPKAHYRVGYLLDEAINTAERYMDTFGFTLTQTAFKAARRGAF